MAHRESDTRTAAIVKRIPKASRKLEVIEKSTGSNSAKFFFLFYSKIHNNTLYTSQLSYSKTSLSCCKAKAIRIFHFILIFVNHKVVRLKLIKCTPKYFSR